MGQLTAKVQYKALQSYDTRHCKGIVQGTAKVQCSALPHNKNSKWTDFQAPDTVMLVSQWLLRLPTRRRYMYDLGRAPYILTGQC